MNADGMNIALREDLRWYGMSDLIDRQAAIDALIAEFKAKTETYWDNGLNMYDVESVLKGLPSAQPAQQWIPCSERLPYPWDEEYLVTLAWGGVGVM